MKSAICRNFVSFLKAKAAFYLPMIICLLFINTCICSVAKSQRIKCGNDAIIQRMKELNPNFDAALQSSQLLMRQQLEANQQSHNVNYRGTATYQVAVIFHFVLDSARVNQIGGVAGIQQRVITQLNQLNLDWNAKNADSVKIPTAFKPLYGNMNVKFVLAGKDPSGNYTPGYEIVYTRKTSFDANTGTTGTTIGFSDLKYASSGGADAWDPSKYYNVWIANMTPAGILGLATPPPHPPYNFFPAAEQGAVILYGAFGRKTASGQYFAYAEATKGRTLTHETAHFFNLFHTWGSSDDCSDDDNIGDTPLQGKSTPNNAPIFPVLDSCSRIFPGIMFMNFMDYAVDTSEYLFTKGQVSASHLELDPGGLRYSLTQHPEVATAIALVKPEHSMAVYPNPVRSTVSVTFNGRDIKTIEITDVVGRTIYKTAVENLTQLIIDLSAHPEGIYFIRALDNNAQLSDVVKVVRAN